MSLKYSENFHSNAKKILNQQSMPKEKNDSQSRFRHIKIKYHYIRNLINEGWCKLVKINTKDQVADMATKILTADTVRYFSKIVVA